MPEGIERNVSPASERSVMVFALVFPTVVTLAYFVLLASAPAMLQQGTYAFGKTIQFVFPIFWVYLVLKRCWKLRAVQRRDLVEGTISGALILGAMLALYHVWLKPAGFFDGPSAEILEKLQALAIDTVPRYAAVGVFYALAHSGLEEYYWRWFVFGQLRRKSTFVLSATVSSVGFMAHHVVLLGTYFGYASPATYLFSGSVAVGGLIWAWMYGRSGSLYGPWLSHLLVDAGIFYIGYDLVGSQFR